MSDNPLRAACIHGRYERHKGTMIPWCPGGRDITIDYDASYKKAETLGLQPWPFDLDDIELIVDTAIGDTDEGGSS